MGRDYETSEEIIADALIDIRDYLAEISESLKKIADSIGENVSTEAKYG